MKTLKFYQSECCLILLIMLVLLPAVGHNQLFVPVSDGAVVNTPSDSRSVNCIDVNMDGYDDLFITNGPSGGAPNFLFMNNGDGTFTQVADDDIVQDTSAFDGATFADADNDGDLDAYVVTWYGLKNYFYRNQGDGSFENEPENVSGSLNTYSETASWGDFDLDGHVDLYATNSGGNKKNLLYLNNGDGGFSQITEGLASTDAYFSRGANWVDFDGDGDSDLFVCNESNQKNNLYRNEGDGEFTKLDDLAPVSGEYGSMSSSWADVDNDGDLDLFIANSLYFSEQNNQLFMNDGDGSFSEVSDMPLVNDGGCSYSSSFTDYDNDGDLDLFVSNGYCSGTIQNFLYKNDGNGYFERDLMSIPDFTTPCSFGAAWADLDHNGFMDLVVSTCKNSSSAATPPNMIFMNEGNDNHWLKVKLLGTSSNRSAIGARILVTAMINGVEVTQRRDINAQDGYCSQNSMTAHFGLGEAPEQIKVTVLWPSGNYYTKETAADTTLVIEESPFTGNIQQKTEKSVRIVAFPDSGSGRIKFSIGNPGAEFLEDITITDLLGRKRGTIAINSNVSEYKVSAEDQLESGFYLASLRHGRTCSVVKFVVHE
jgi:hypothetical protein